DVLAEIAVGATARVELCRVLEGARKDQFVAVKRLHSHIAEDPAFVDMLRDEVWMSAALKHGHVVEVVGWGEGPEGPWLAVELVRGVSLQRLMKTVFETGEKFTERLVVYIGRCICDGLAEAHNLRSAEGGMLNLVHRDLTPGNILLGFKGEVKITDFGLAKAKQRLTKTLTGLLKGQPQYMSPEQVQGGTLDGRSDLFALGVVLFELFSGRRPWKASTDLDAMRAITDDEPESLLGLRPNIDKALVQIVSSCLEKKPGDRCESAASLRDRLAQWLTAHGYKDDNQSVLARFVRRNAMRQMRWFERAVEGEFAKQLATDRQLPLLGNKRSVPAPSSFPPPANKALTAVTSPTRKGTMATNQTVAEAPNSRKRAPRAGAAVKGKPAGAKLGGAAGKPATLAAGENAGDKAKAERQIDWGEDGPTLIQKSEEARQALEEVDRQAAAGESSIDATTRRQRAHKGPVPRRAQAAASPVSQAPAAAGAAPGQPKPGLGAPGAPDGIEEEDTTTQDESLTLAKGAQAVNAAVAAKRHAAASPTDAFPAPGIVAPHDPHVPPLPADGSGAVPAGAGPAAAAPAAPVPDPDGTETAIAIKPEALLADPTTDGDAPTVEAVVPALPGEQINLGPVQDQKLAPLPVPRFPSLPSMEGRSGDVGSEARRLGEEAKHAAETAGRAAALAEAAARAAALAGEASLLAAVGDQHGATQRLLEAQLVDEALKRGEIPAKGSIQLGGPDLGESDKNWLVRATTVLGSREGVTLIVIVTIGLMLVVLFLSLLW
ncbi:MAG: hypothetical protein DRI90_18975, partial [Deltaproteobacteria bacterium]